MKNFFGLILLLSFFFFSCDRLRGIQNKPQIPDFSELKVELPEFIDSVNIDTVTQKTLSDYSNFILARQKLLFWHQKVFLENKLVFQLLDNFDNLELSYWGNNTWHSKKVFSIDSNNYDIEIYGTVNSDENVFWELYVAVNNSKQFKFLDGNVYLSSQSWQIYKHNIITYKTLKIEISQTNTDNQIKDFYILNENSDYYGSSVNWEKDNTLFKTHISNSYTDETFNIYFDIDNRYGGICDTVCNCWNDQFLNSETCYDCPF